MSIGIYKITNPKGESYIGSSFDIERRWQQYKTLKNKDQKLINESLILYGYVNHIFEIIEKYDNITSRELRKKKK